MKKKMNLNRIRTIQRISFPQYRQFCDSGSKQVGKKNVPHVFVSHVIYAEINVGTAFCTISS